MYGITSKQKQKSEYICFHIASYHLPIQRVSALRLSSEVNTTTPAFKRYMCLHEYSISYCNYTNVMYIYVSIIQKIIF